MTSNPISESDTPQQSSFWKRQFAANGTQPQAVVDVVFGLVAPILCFYFDPIVFKGGIIGVPLLQPYQLFAYGVSAVQVSFLALALLFGHRLGAWSRLVGGTLISGSVFSAVVGFAILPYTLIGLMVGIGLLGFIPFLTAFVYLRVGWRALKCEDQTPLASWISVLLFGAILSLGIPALVSFYVSRTTSNSIETILHGSAQQAEVAVVHLQRLPFIPQESLEPLVAAYLNEKDQNKKERLKNSYRALTGEDIDIRARILVD